MLPPDYLLFPTIDIVIEHLIHSNRKLARQDVQIAYTSKGTSITVFQIAIQLNRKTSSWESHLLLLTTLYLYSTFRMKAVAILHSLSI